MNILSSKISRFALAALVATSLVGAPVALATSASAATSVSVVAKKAPVKHKTVKKTVKTVKTVKRTSVKSLRVMSIKAVPRNCNTPNKIVCSQLDKNGKFDRRTLAKARPLEICLPGKKVNLGIVPSQTDACGRFVPSKIAYAKPLVISFR